MLTVPTPTTLWQLPTQELMTSHRTHYALARRLVAFAYSEALERVPSERRDALRRATVELAIENLSTSSGADDGTVHERLRGLTRALIDAAPMDRRVAALLSDLEELRAEREHALP